ncbi:MAG: tRNA pseudouridine(38-40) synthase TruA [Archaeoglobaceae archaeon]|nr:tRNA pseudouridine(38-40) synthase TruA [Archaeoglobaceae archaeon]MDW7989472.1 tRNA pseudouridine(38-40) synthase TruA [Archaeoglobaceae archaeon]
MKYAFKIAYFGENFFGSQYQPNLRTVEGEIRRALLELGINSKPRFAGRTDRGVSALGQVIVFESESRLKPRILNSVLPSDITTWAYREVEVGFDPRKAKSRIYSYIFLNENYDFEMMTRALDFLKGSHDFSNFTRRWEGGKREIFDVNLFKDGDFIIFEIEGNAFTWNMVRCIVTALKLVGRGKSLEWFKKMLKPEEYRERVPPSQPEGLLLKDIKYDFSFEIDEIGLRLLNLRLKKKLSFHGVIYKLLSLEFKTLNS